MKYFIAANSPEEQQSILDFRDFMRNRRIKDSDHGSHDVPLTCISTHRKQKLQQKHET